MAYPDAYSFTLYPYAHRSVIDAVLRLPWEYRRVGTLREDVIASRWRTCSTLPSIARRYGSQLAAAHARRSASPAPGSDEPVRAKRSDGSRCTMSHLRHSGR